MKQYTSDSLSLLVHAFSKSTSVKYINLDIAYVLITVTLFILYANIILFYNKPLTFCKWTERMFIFCITIACYSLYRTLKCWKSFCCYNKWNLWRTRRPLYCWYSIYSSNIFVIRWHSGTALLYYVCITQDMHAYPCNSLTYKFGVSSDFTMVTSLFALH
jgi:hypothetical protein